MAETVHDAPAIAEPRRRLVYYQEGSVTPAIFKVVAMIAFAVMLIPAAVVLLAGLNQAEYITFPPQGLTLRWVIAFFQSDAFRGAFFTSLGLALMVMVISTTLGTMAAVFLSRVAFRFRGILRAVLISPILLPGVVLGMAIFIFYVFSGIGLSRTYTGLLIGHIIVTVPWVIAAVSAALYHYDISLEQAARSLGAGPLTAFFRITLPNISSGVSAGSIFAFIVSFGQFDVSLFLSTANVTPLPIAIFQSLRNRAEPTAAAAGVVAIVLVIAVMLIGSQVVNVRRLISTERAKGKK
ncbi:MAG: ABC transporter permease [Proteobacteria bacterium]|nr:ABC transporter permease [Pseudomonadota bacterium]